MGYLRDVTISIIDAQAFSASLQRQMLRVIGARHIKTFERADEAWAAFKHTPSDIMLVGWRLEPFNGIALIDRLRNHPETPNPYVPIIMITAFGDEERVAVARDAGVNEYVIKPLSPKALFTRVENVIERPRRFVRVADFFGPDRRRATKPFKGPGRREDERPPPSSKTSKTGASEDVAAD